MVHAIVKSRLFVTLLLGIHMAMRVLIADDERCCRDFLQDLVEQYDLGLDGNTLPKM
jgi:hypothetical protein